MTKGNLGASFPGEEFWGTVESLRPGGGLRAQASHLSLFTWGEGLATIPHQGHSRGRQLCARGRVSYQRRWGSTFQNAFTLFTLCEGPCCQEQARVYCSRFTNAETGCEELGDVLKTSQLAL